MENSSFGVLKPIRQLNIILIFCGNSVLLYPTPKYLQKNFKKP